MRNTSPLESVLTQLSFPLPFPSLSVSARLITGNEKSFNTAPLGSHVVLWTARLTVRFFQGSTRRRTPFLHSIFLFSLCSTHQLGAKRSKHFQFDLHPVKGEQF
jgi:hypothetical protein